MLLTTPPIAPKTLQTLQQLGIHTLQDLQQLGATQTFLLLKAAGQTVTRSTLWQLAALIEGSAPQDLSEHCKQQLLQSIRRHPPVAVFPSESDMEYFMRHALAAAAKAAESGEVPVGSVIVHQNRIIATAYNRCIQDCNISHHAEIMALTQAGQTLQNYRLEDCDIYITLEPCAMCAGALIQARVRRVVYGAPESKTGAAGSVTNLFANTILNKHTAVKGGVLADESRNLLQQFFQNKRRSNPAGYTSD